ncbi:hypothetical protein GWE18_00285 [Bradyrhizobium sp. CSA112]|uniref:hypothetical protein n=1 Tax=Bradyrhizobium sp. CSA112 TaxID=2699170 RepID=UPI0023AECF05|nr:hypothetical protein [Bradyrhizobium sp. CSA112]MDE5451314.1 hypothetical protein [Bradyrhizobium sp. CSA112]
MGEVVQLRDYQNPKDIERMRQAELLATQRAIVAAVSSETVPYNGAGIDGMGLEKDQ